MTIIKIKYPKIQWTKTLRRLRSCFGIHKFKPYSKDTNMRLISIPEKEAYDPLITPTPSKFHCEDPGSDDF
jgi:hypothetical protein